MILKSAQFVVVFFFTIQTIFAQADKIIVGKIWVKNGSPQDVKILNLVNEKETISDFEGNFVIPAKTDDLLIFSAMNLEYHRQNIDEDNYKLGKIKVEMTVKTTQLEEVKIITYPNINALNLGILSVPAKVYSVAERRLYEATSGGGLMVLMNTLNGKTKMLKRYVAFEKAEHNAKKLSEMFPADYYIKTLKIDANLVKSFQNYAVENQEVVKGLVEKNNFVVSFALSKIAPQFNDLQKIIKK